MLGGPFPTMWITEKQCQPCSSLLAMGAHFYLTATYWVNKLYTLSLHFFYSNHAWRKGYGVAWNAPPASGGTNPNTADNHGIIKTLASKDFTSANRTTSGEPNPQARGKNVREAWMHTGPWRNIKENLPRATFLAAKILYLNKSLGKTKRI